MKKKILIIGKKNHIGWSEYVKNGFLVNGFDAKIFYTNRLSILGSLKKGFGKIIKDKSINYIVQIDELNRVIKKFRPDIIFFVSAFFSDISLYECCKSYNIPTIGWVGDKFGIEKSGYAKYLDFLFVSDSYFVKIAKEIGFKEVELLQFGYDETIHKNLNLIRRASTNFVGSYTKDRDKILSDLTEYNMEIYGYRWDKLSNISKNWVVESKKISQKKVAKIYNSTIATLNIAQKENIENMVNMRTFEAIACGSCVISDDVKDLELCFEDKKEILVYKDIDELKEIFDRIKKDKKFIENIAANGLRRSKESGYSYNDRMKQVIKICNF